MKFDKDELKYLKRAIANAKSIEAIAYENIIFAGDEYLRAYKKKLKRCDLLISIVAPVVFIVLLIIIKTNSKLVQFAIISIIMAISYLIHERLVITILPDDSFKHMKKV